MTFLFGGGGMPSPKKIKPMPTRIEPAEKPPKRKRARSLATQAMLSEPMIREEKLGT